MLKCRFYCYFYGIFMRALMCAYCIYSGLAHVVLAILAPFSQTVASHTAHAFKVGLWSHKINCDYRRAFNSGSPWLGVLHLVAAGIRRLTLTHSVWQIRAWSRRLSHKNDKNKIKKQSTNLLEPQQTSYRIVCLCLCVCTMYHRRSSDSIQSMSRWTKLHIMNEMMWWHDARIYTQIDSSNLLCSKSTHRLMPGNNKWEQIKLMLFFTACMRLLYVCCTWVLLSLCVWVWVSVRMCERAFMLCFMFAALVFNRLQSEIIWWRRQRRWRWRRRWRGMPKRC